MKDRKLILAITVAVVTAMLVPAAAHGQTCTLYVATDGNDANAGTLSNPWRHIQKAATAATPGSTVCVRKGVYNEQVDVRVSGSATAGYITFQSFPGEHAIVDGTGIDSTSNDGFPVGLFQIKNRRYIAVQNLEVRNFTGKNDGSTFPAGIYVGITGSHIQILNNTVHNINGSPNHTQGAHGIAAYGTSANASINNLTVSGNQVFNNHLSRANPPYSTATSSFGGLQTTSSTTTTTSDSTPSATNQLRRYLQCAAPIAVSAPAMVTSVKILSTT
jgi:hypothetical protein